MVISVPESVYGLYFEGLFLEYIEADKCMLIVREPASVPVRVPSRLSDLKYTASVVPVPTTRSLVRILY